MKHTIFQRFTENNKWNDYVDLKSFECKSALIITLLFIVFFIKIGIHENFSLYTTVLRNVTLSIAQALIGLIGIIIAGVAITFSVLNKKIVKAIEKISKRSVQQLIVSFEFLAFNVGIGIFIFFLAHFSLYSDLPLLNKYVFYISLALITYFLFFIIFYSISLISNIVRLIYIANVYNEINTNDKNIYTKANEIRIDFILKTLLNFTQTEKEDFLRSLDEFVDASNIQDKVKIKEYFNNYYDG